MVDESSLASWREHASEESRVLVVSLRLAASEATVAAVFRGLRRLCRLFAAIDSGAKHLEARDAETGRAEPIHLREVFQFSATLGFGEGFFDLLQIPPGKWPSQLKATPDVDDPDDTSPEEVEPSDVVLRLRSTSHSVNRWVLENSRRRKDGAGGSSGHDETPADIVSAVAGWAAITDVSAGLRPDGRRPRASSPNGAGTRAGFPPFDAASSIN